MHLAGELTDWGINDLLQIMQVTKKTGSLDITAAPNGRVHFREGMVTGAEVSDAKGARAGADLSGVIDIVYALSRLESGTFTVGPADGPDSPRWSVDEVMADVEVVRSLEDEVTNSGLVEAVGVRLAKEVSEPMTLAPADWSALVLLVRPFSFGDLETELGRGGAVRVFHALHRLGVAEAVEEVEPEAADLPTEGEALADAPHAPPHAAAHVGEGPSRSTFSSDLGGPVGAGTDSGDAPEVDFGAVSESEPGDHSTAESGDAPGVEAESGEHSTADPGYAPDAEFESGDDTRAESGDVPEAEAESGDVPEAESSDASDDSPGDDSPGGDASEMAEGEASAALGVSAPASTTLTDGVYNEIRRLRSRAVEGKLSARGQRSRR